MTDRENQNTMQPSERARDIPAERRSIIFKIIRTDSINSTGQKKNEVVVSIPFDTAASDAELRAYAESEVKRLEEIRKVIAAPPNPLKPFKRFAMHFRDLEEDRVCEPLIAFDTADSTVESFREKIFKAMDAWMESHKSFIYQALILYVEKRGWSFDGLGKVRNRHLWREACAETHPFFLSREWSEERRDGFARLSIQTILRGLRTGTYTSKNFQKKRTKRVSSAKEVDHNARIRKSTKRSKRRS